MFIKFPILSRIIFFIIIPLGLILLVVVTKLFASIPNLNSTVLMNDIENKVVISRDKHGIPLIKGETDRDVFFAMGYVQAQDRLWQMENQRRLAAGKLSEVFGLGTLSSDVLMRTLGLYPSAQKAWSSLGLGAQQALQAYADGVNAWLAEGNQLPLEFSVFMFQPEPWTPIDSIALSKVFALNMGANYILETQRLLAQQLLSSQQFGSLYPEVNLHPQATQAAVNTLLNILTVGETLKQEQFVGGENVGSNAWVISGKLTQSGAPILANDPHLALQIPSLWYAATLEGENIHASGMALIGLPVIVLGENKFIAWGGTNLLADTQDLVSEQINPKNAQLYLHEGAWTPFSEHEEVIHISAGFPKALKKAIEPFKLKVRSTLNGPVMSDATGSNGQILSLRWTALAPDDTTFESFFKLNYATDWEAFRNALGFHVAPTMNILYADKQGNIGYSAAGRIPVRPSGSDGMLPSDATSKTWQSYVPWSAMPQQHNPGSGFLINANNKMIDESYPYFISNDWPDPIRATRINQLLTIKIAANEKIDVPYVSQMQNDVVDLNAIHFIKTIKMLLGDSAGNNLLAELYGWNGDMHADSPAPALYISSMRQLKKSLYMDEFTSRGISFQIQAQGDDAINNIIDAIKVNTVEKTLTTDQYWCDDTGTEAVENCKEIIQSSFNLAKKELSKIAGRSSDNWRWGDLSKRNYQHQPFSQVNAIKGFFGRKAKGDGSFDTINVSGYSFNESDGYVQDYGAGFRQIFELTPDEKHFLINSTGQSGNVFSEFYDDMVELMSANSAYALQATAHEHVTILLPGKQNIHNKSESK